MAMQTMTASSTVADSGRRIKSALFAPAESIIAAFDRYRAYRRSVAELEACSDRDLSDLGIYRCDIRRLAKEAIYGEGA